MAAESFDHFDGERAYQDVVYQVALGPRTPGSPAHDSVVEWIVSETNARGWETSLQQGQFMGHDITNVIARRGSGMPFLLIGAHYDTRLVSDRDANEQFHATPVPGANDGASGVAVLVELARTLPEDLPGEVWLVFFDAEDNGGLPGREWLMGSLYFVEKLTAKPEAVIIIDMIGDANLNIYPEKVSDPALTAEIWEQAKALGYGEYFFDKAKYGIVDDHRPFLHDGIPAIDIIDFDYPFWHTTQDTVDKISADSLQVIGDTLTVWLKARSSGG
ncbi:MAG: M28 family peptidase [Chloroflexi bacterium]|nr:M28 family peptidase [Chloroflexota bacterium]